MSSASLLVGPRRALTGSAGDIALAAMLALFAAFDVLLSPEWRGPDAVNAVVVPATALSLAWRRKRPLAVLASVVAAYAGLSLAFGATQSWSFTFIMIVGLYSAVLYGSRPLLAGPLAAVGIVIASLTDPLIDSFGDAVWGPSLIVLTAAAGFTGRAVRARSSALEHRAQTLDREAQQRAAEAAAEERRRIARELHDIISHSLGVVVLQAGAAERVVDRDPQRAREVLQSIRSTGQAAVGEMATLLGLLDPSPRASREPQPSLADIDGLVARMRDAGLSIDFVIDGRRRVLPAAIELSAFRVLQEALTNTLKHAPGTQVDAVLCYEEAELQVEVSNTAAAPGTVGAGSGRGLAGMRERVEIFGGTLEAGPESDGGWRLRATFPVSS